MSKKKYNLNTIYISERLQENLKPISQSAFTAVTAPMGYGKTTAINWYLDKQSKNGNSCVIRISIYSDNLSVFWQSVQKAFAFAGLDFLDNYSCPSDAASAGMLADELCYSLSSQTSYYIFIDDFHLLGEPHVADYILKDRDGVLNVFIHGDMPEKIKRITGLYNVKEKEAVKMMTDTDKRRRTNYNFYTDQNWGKASNYTLCLNSSQLGYDRCEMIIMECVK